MRKKFFIKNYLTKIKKLIKAFINKSKKEGISSAFFIARKYIFDKGTLIMEGGVRAPLYHPDLLLQPLVSILIVSYNSKEDLIPLFHSINKQTYRNLEIVLVENGTQSSESCLDILEFPFKYIPSGNIGFAAGNNLALKHSNGTYVCLVNPDTILDFKVIDKLLFSILSDGDAAVSVPKIVFYEKFIDLDIFSDKPFYIDLRILDESLEYKKYFIRDGHESIYGDFRREVHSNNNHIKLCLPVDNSNAILKFFKSHKDQILNYKINNSIINNSKIIEITQNSSSTDLHLNLDKDLIWWGRDMINNAGSGLNNGRPFDRGFAEYDVGQYDFSEKVSALCGCVAMISPKVFVERKIFIDEFFAYFEDSELSRWINNKNYKINYNPHAIVRHKHSVSTSERSDLWFTLVDRSSDIYEFLKNSNKKIKENHFNNEYLKIKKNLANILKEYDDNLIGKSHKSLIKKSRPSAAIYNSYWNTMGGGEKHALALAKTLARTHDIFLISENDFNEKKLKEYFSINFKFKKYIKSSITPELTSSFDTFINSTYCSNLISMCPKSFYLVSFPHKFVNKEFLNSYFFLHNSIYTQKWAKRYWGLHKNKILYPVTDMKGFNKKINQDEHFLKNNKKNIISVGRFTEDGHTKRHDFILKAFIKAQNINPSEFNLFLVGSLDYSRQNDLNYFSSLEALQTKNIYLFPNLEFKKLIELFSISKFYVHATGIEKNEQKNPEQLEHFGITIIEALLYDNYPIVYEKGGPAETINLLKCGETFNDLKSLVKIFSKIFNDHENEKYSLKNDLLKDFLDKNNHELLKTFSE